MDLVNPSKGSPGGGSFRSALVKYGVNGLRAMAALPENTQKIIDKTVVKVGRQRLSVVDKLLSAGLIYNLPNWLSVPSIRREAANESGRAQVTMVPKARGERQLGDRKGFTIPIPCQWDDFSFNVREIAASDRVGASLQTSHIEQATRNVNELIEDMAINGLVDANGDPILIDGLPITGLLSSTSTDSYPDWNTLTGAQIVAVIQGSIEQQRVNKFYGPYTYFVPGNYSGLLGNDYNTYANKTVLQRINDLGPYGGRNLEVVVADFLPDHRTLNVQMTSDVVDVVVGQTPATVSWTDGPGWEDFFVVLACMITRFFPNYNGDYGVVAGDLE